jgi:dissimilatory sulfite reductase related protein
MAEKNLAGKMVEVTEEGYLVNVEDWSKDLAAEMAREDGIELTDKHYEVLDYLRKEQATGASLTIRKVGKSGITDIKGLYKLFPGGPLKLSSKYAGIPKPASCV